MRLKLFELFATLSLDTKDFDKGVKSAAKQGESLGATIKNKVGAGTIAMGNLIAGAVQKVGDAAWQMGKRAWSGVAELEQNLGGSEAVWGEWADEIQATASHAFSAMGLSMSDYLAEANKMGSLLKGSGYTTAEAYQMTTDVMQRASDVASIMGIDVASAMQAIEGAAKGNFTMMDNLGVAINDTTLANYALEKGITKSTRSMTTQEKTALAFQLFMEKTAGYAGNYAQENDTLAGSFTTLSAAFDNFLAGQGTVDEFVDAVENAARVGFKTLGEMVPRLWESGRQAIAKLLPKAKQALIDFWDNDAPEIIKGGVNAVIDGVNAIFGTNIPKIEKIDMPTVEEISAIVTDWWDTGGRSAVESACTWVLNLFGVPSETASQVANTVGSWWSGCVSAVEGACKWGLKFFGVKPWTDDDTQKIRDWWIGVSETVEGAIDWVIKAEPQDYAEFANYVKNEWFPNVLKSIGTLVIPIATTIMKPVTSAVESLSGLEEGTIEAGYQTMMDTAESLTDPNAWNQYKNIPSLLDMFKKSHATGLDYVPYNNYAARLHEGEAVLTKAEATAWRRGDGATSPAIDYDRLAGAIASAMAGTSVQMDGQAVGVLVAPTVSRQFGRQTLAHKHTTR